MEFLNWETLGTTSGLLAAVLIVTQLIKGVPYISKVPTQIVSWALAMCMIITGDVINGGVSWDGILLAIVNAAMISLASNGGFDAVKRIIDGKSEEE